MAKFFGKFKKDGFDFGVGRDRILHHCKFNIGRRFVLEDIIPESKKQRGFFEGGVLGLWAFLDGNDPKDSITLNQYHEYAKEEFNPEYKIIDGKSRKVGASTKGKLNGENGIVNKVIDHLEEQYGIDRTQCLMPKQFKHWRDAIFPNGGPDNYPEYLFELKKIPTKLSP